MRIVILFILFSTSLKARCPDTFSLKSECDYLWLKSTPSSTSMSGFLGGFRAIHEHRFETAGYTDCLYWILGPLGGEDLFDDDVRIQYTELDGNFRLNLYFCYHELHITPFIGYGIRQHRFKRVRPSNLLQEINYLYIPLGLAVSYDWRANLSLCAEFKLGMMTYTLWRYIHPVIEAQYRHLEKAPSYEGNISLTWRPSCHLSFTLSPAFRFVDLRFPQNILFAPESKQLYYSCICLGAEYSY